jgi:hypothetical protein
MLRTDISNSAYHSQGELVAERGVVFDHVMPGQGVAQDEESHA